MVCMEQEKYFTIRYRVGPYKLFSLDSILHSGPIKIVKGEKKILQLTFANNPNQAPVVINLSEINNLKQHGAVVAIKASGEEHLFDFSDPFYEGIFKKFSPKKRAKEFTDFLAERGVKLEK